MTSEIVLFERADLAEIENPAFIYVQSLASESSRATMLQVVERLAAEMSGGAVPAFRFPWWKLRFKHTQLIRAHLLNRLNMAPHTVNKYLVGIRQTLRFAFRGGLMTADEYHGAIEIKDIFSDPLPAGRRVTRGELTACIQGCPGTVNGDRDAALLAVFYGTGVRRAELIALDLADYSPVEELLVVLHGKGRTQRNARVVPSAATHLERWIVRRDTGPGPLFYPVRVGGEIEHRRLSAVAVVMALRRIADRAQVERFSPHDLRRTWITDLLEGGVDLAMIRTLAGHKNVSTTAGYDRRGEREAHLAAEVISVPKREGKPCKPSDGQKKQ